MKSLSGRQSLALALTRNLTLPKELESKTKSMPRRPYFHQNQRSEVLVWRHASANIASLVGGNQGIAAAMPHSEGRGGAGARRAGGGD